MSHRPRILLCCEHYPPSVGGVQEVMRQIAERLVEAGVDVTVATSTHSDREADAMRHGVRVVSFPIAGNLRKGIKGPLNDYRSLLLTGRFDALMIKAAQQWTFDAAIDVLPKLTCRKLFIPCGFSGLNDPLYGGYYRQMPSWLRYFDGLIFYASEYQDISFARKNGLTHLHLIPNGVDEREFFDSYDHDIRQRLGVDQAHDVLFSVGSQIASKGHWEVVRAFGRAKLPRPATLVINANAPGSGLARLKRHVKNALGGRWPLSWLALWHGQNCKRVLIVDLPRNDVVNMYKATDLFVFASHVEYSPLVLFEAAAAGAAFLTSSAGNSQEIAGWTKGGVVVPNHSRNNGELSTEVLANYIELMLDDMDFLQDMGRVARATVLFKGFTWQNIVKQYIHLLLGSKNDST